MVFVKLTFGFYQDDNWGETTTAVTNISDLEFNGNFSKNLETDSKQL